MSLDSYASCLILKVPQSITVFLLNFLVRYATIADAIRHISAAGTGCFLSKTVTKNEGVVSKETVVLRRWGSSIQKFGFINGVDNVNWPPYRDSKS